MKIIILATAIGLSMIATPSYTQEARRIDFTQPILIDGHAVISDFKCPLPIDQAGRITGPRPCQDAFTLGELAAAALNRPTENQTFSDAVRRNELANHIRYAKDWPILKDQIEMIETAMGPVYSPPILGAVAAIFDAP